MTFVLPDPHDEDWSGCLIAYVAARSATLRRLEMLRSRLNQVEDRAQAAEDEGVDLTVRSPLRSEMLDRVYLLSIIQGTERTYLSGLRLYLDLCRAVHGKIDRQRYDLICDLRRLGVPGHIARKMADDGVIPIDDET